MVKFQSMRFQGLNQVRKKLRQPMGIRFFCDQLTELSPVFFVGSHRMENARTLPNQSLGVACG